SDLDERALAAALAAAPADAEGWVRGVGHAESVAGLLDAAALDRLHPNRPVRLQHRGGSLWILNTTAIRLLGLDRIEDSGIERDLGGRPTGRVWCADHLVRSSAEQQSRTHPDTLPDLALVAGKLARWGVTSVTDATPGLAPGIVLALAERMRRGVLPQRVRLLGAPFETGLPNGRLTAGPWKVVIRDDALPGLDELVQEIAYAHLTGRPVALHCLSVEALYLALAALEEADALEGDRIEHAALVPAWCLNRLRTLGLRVVTQPAFLADRGEDMLRGTPPDEHEDLYRYAGLLRAGIPVLPSSDAPYGPADPWRAMAAARDRTTETGRCAQPAERVEVAIALSGYLAPSHLPSSRAAPLGAGADADVVLLEGDLRDVLAEPGAARVRLTVAGGRMVHRVS
ncbi:amidohydrolase family protein, partial [Nonomuraea sp. NPDC003201]